MGVSDIRGKKTNEILQGIKIIKFNAWEKILSDQIQKLRNSEIKTYRMIFLIRGFGSAIIAFLPVACGLAVFPLYDVLYPDDPLTIPQIINILNIITSIISPLRFYIMMVMNVKEA